MSELQSFTQKVGFKRNQPPVLYSRQVLTCKVNPDRSNHSKPPPSRCISTRQSERSVVSHVGQSRQNSRMRKAEDAFVRRSVTNNNEANKTKSSNEIETEALNGNLVHFEDNETYVRLHNADMIGFAGIYTYMGTDEDLKLELCTLSHTLQDFSIVMV